MQMNMDQNKSNDMDRPTPSGVSGQPATPVVEAPGLTRTPSVDSVLRVLATLLDLESAASVDVASTMATAPLPIPELYVDPGAHPPAVTATTVDWATHVASSTTRSAVAPAPAAAATAAEASDENPNTSFAWKSKRESSKRQSAEATKVSRPQSRQQRARNQQTSFQGTQQGRVAAVRNHNVQATYNCRVYPCEVCRYHFDVSLERQQALVNWFRDSNNIEHHLSFLCGLIFTISLSMLLTFFWLEYARRTVNVSWLLAVPLRIAFAIHSFVWVSTALFFLWLYPKEFWTWKNQTLPDISRTLIHLATGSDSVAAEVP